VLPEIEPATDVIESTTPQPPSVHVVILGLNIIRFVALTSLYSTSHLFIH